jgi:aspartyl protease family protein
MLFRISCTLLVFALVVITPNRVQSQSPECLVEAPRGVGNVDLNRLCRIEPPPRNSSITQGSFLIPIKRRVGGIPIVEVVFNGVHRYEMLFDTGASSVVLTDNMAQVIGVKKELSVAANTAGGPAKAYLGQVKSAQAGNLKLNNLVVGISPQLAGGLGLLGQNFLNGYDVIIRKNQIELHPSKS